jgi:XapX domain-containing protein
MKALLISFALGLIVGVAYGVIRVKSPVPPIVALLGLFGMVSASGRTASYKEVPNYKRSFSSTMK